MIDGGLKVGLENTFYVNQASIPTKDREGLQFPASSVKLYLQSDRGIDSVFDVTSHLFFDGQAVEEYGLDSNLRRSELTVRLSSRSLEIVSGVRNTRSDRTWRTLDPRTDLLLQGVYQLESNTLNALHVDRDNRVFYGARMITPAYVAASGVIHDPPRYDLRLVLTPDEFHQLSALPANTAFRIDGIQQSAKS